MRVVWNVRVPRMYFQKDDWVETRNPENVGVKQHNRQYVTTCVLTGATPMHHTSALLIHSLVYSYDKVEVAVNTKTTFEVNCSSGLRVS